MARVLCAILLVLYGFTVKAQKVDLKLTSYPIPSTGMVIYAAPEDAAINPGKITNTGTSPSSPWTLTRAMLDAPVNATIIVRGGEYRSVSQNRITNKITIQAYPGEEPWIKGSIVITDWEKVAGTNVWVHANWPYEFPENTVEEDIGINPLCDNRDMIFINDRSLRQVDSLKKVSAGTFYIDYAGDKLYIGADPATGRIESTRFASPLVRKSPSGAEIRVPNGTTIKGLGFTHYADQGLEAVCFGGLRLEDNTFSWNGTAGATLVAPTAVIRGNIFAFNGGVGMSGNNLRETLVEGNHAYQNNIESYSLSWSAAGIKVIATKNMRLRSNLIENNHAVGIWLDISAIDNELIYNTVRDNGGFGIFSETSNGTFIAGNILVNNKNYGVALSDADSSEVWNNTIVSNTGRGFFIKDTPRESKNTMPGGTFYSYVFANSKECSWITRANVIKNNLVVTNTGLWMENTAPSVLQVKESDFNGYYRTAAAEGNVYRWSNVNYTTLEAFKTAFPAYEKNSIASYRQSSNPFFNDTTYRLKANSPAIKAGTALPEKIAVLLGLPFNNKALDMGAVQTAPPAPPSGLVATGRSQTEINLSWTDQADNETGFMIEIRPASDSAFTVIDTTAANATAYSSTGLKANTRYTFKVVAYNAAGNSAYTNEASAVTLPDVLLAATDLAATVLSQRTISLTWTDNANNEDGYKVERSTAGGVFETIVTLPANVTSYKETNLVASTSYTYKATAFTSTRETSSVEETVTTAAAGTGLLATYYRSKYFVGGSFLRTDATVDFNWGAGSPDASISHNTFSVKWEGQIEARYSETYTFKTVTDDGVKVWINGQLLINDFNGNGQRTNTATIAMEADRKYSIKIEYFENSGTAMAHLYWSSPGQAEEIVPQSQLYPATPAPSYGSFKEIMEVKLSPNPARGQTTLLFDAREGELLKVTVINMVNVVVLTYNATTQPGANKVILDISSLRPGVYAVMLQRGNTILPKLLIVK